MESRCSTRRASSPLHNPQRLSAAVRCCYFALRPQPDNVAPLNVLLALAAWQGCERQLREGACALWLVPVLAANRAGPSTSHAPHVPSEGPLAGRQRGLRRMLATGHHVLRAPTQGINHVDSIFQEEGDFDKVKARVESVSGTECVCGLQPLQRTPKPRQHCPRPSTPCQPARSVRCLAHDHAMVELSVRASHVVEPCLLTHGAFAAAHPRCCGPRINWSCPRLLRLRPSTNVHGTPRLFR